MTRVEFFFNVTDKFAKVAELCEKAVAKKHQLTIFTQNDAMSVALQQQLWTLSATSFLPNAHTNEPTIEHTPIIVDSAGSHLIQDDILINLQTEYPPFFSRFRHLVELVGHDEKDRIAARVRYKFYRDRGYQVKSTDVSTS